MRTILEYFQRLPQAHRDETIDFFSAKTALHVFIKVFALNICIPFNHHSDSTSGWTLRVRIVSQKSHMAANKNLNEYLFPTIRLMNWNVETNEMNKIIIGVFFLSPLRGILSIMLWFITYEIISKQFFNVHFLTQTCFRSLMSCCIDSKQHYQLKINNKLTNKIVAVSNLINFLDY